MNTERGFVCEGCFLLFSDKRFGLPECPACSHRETLRLDSTSYVYWAEAKTREGEDFFRKNFWFSPRWANKSWLTIWRSGAFTEKKEI